MQFTSLVKQYFMHKDPQQWWSVFWYVHSAFVYITYWVSNSGLFLHCRGYYDMWAWRRRVDFLTAKSKYEHFDVVIFWLWVLYLILSVYLRYDYIRDPLRIRSDLLNTYVITYIYISEIGECFIHREKKQIHIKEKQMITKKKERKKENGNNKNFF